MVKRFGSHYSASRLFYQANEDFGGSPIFAGPAAPSRQPARIFTYRETENDTPSFISRGVPILEPGKLGNLQAIHLQRFRASGALFLPGCSRSSPRPQAMRQQRTLSCGRRRNHRNRNRTNLLDRRRAVAFAVNHHARHVHGRRLEFAFNLCIHLERALEGAVLRLVRELERGWILARLRVVKDAFLLATAKLLTECLFYLTKMVYDAEDFPGHLLLGGLALHEGHGAEFLAFATGELQQALVQSIV